MSRIRGTNVMSPIRPYDTRDTYPTALSDEIKGGYKSVENKGQLFMIPKPRRQIGMAVYVNSEQRLYMLKTDSGKAMTGPEDWISYKVNANDIVTPPNVNQSTNPDYIKQLPSEKGMALNDKVNKAYNTAVLRYMTFILNPVKLGPSDIEVVCPFDCILYGYNMSVPQNITVHSNITASIEAFTGDPSDPLSVSNWVKMGDSTIYPSSSNSSTTKIFELDQINSVNGHIESQSHFITAGTRIRCNVTELIDKVPSLSYVLYLREAKYSDVFVDDGR